MFAGAAADLASAELLLTIPGIDPDSVQTLRRGGVDHVDFTAPLAPAHLSRLASQFLIYQHNPDGSQVPLELPPATLLDQDLVTIPKYPGKTNEQFTRLLVNLALAALPADPDRPLDILDPLCGRGTTTSVAWLLGHHGFGVEVDGSAIEAHAGFLRTWLRRKRLKHKVTLSPVRRDGRSLGKRLDAQLTLPDHPSLHLGILPGDGRDSATLWGKRRFDAVITDAPYGVVHGSHARHARHPQHSQRSRNPGDLLREAIEVWAGQLRSPGVMAISWNTLGVDREQLLSWMSAAGLEPCDHGAWQRLSHRVDSSIHRDIAVAVRP